MNYTHLTQDERYRIAVLHKAGHKQNAIAKLIGRNESSISREMRRNRGQRGYRPKQAQALYQARKRGCENGPRIADKTWAFAQAKLAERWSPEQISGYLKANDLPTVSHETPYQRLYADKRTAARYTATCAARNSARSAMEAENDVAPYPTGFLSTSVLPSWPSVRALATGRAIWSSAQASSKRS